MSTFPDVISTSFVSPPHFYLQHTHHHASVKQLKPNASY
jgi:hypothetical protein